MNAEERQKRLLALDKRVCSVAPTTTTNERKRSGADLDSAILIDEADDGARKKQKTHGLSNGSSQDNTRMVVNLGRPLEFSDSNTNAASVSTSSIKSEIQHTSFANSTTPRYLTGEVLLTAAKGHGRLAHHVTIEELFDRNTLRRAVLSSFQIDLEWLLPKLNLGRTALYLSFHAKEPETNLQWTRVCAALPKVFPIFPPMGTVVNCMHSKLQLLFFDGFLRIVFPSANLVSYDWGECGTMENILYVQDFPVKPTTTTTTTTTSTITPVEDVIHSRFLDDLTRFLMASAYPDVIINDMKRYDLSETLDIRFLGTIGGENYDDRIKDSGISRLAHVIPTFCPESQKEQRRRMDYITASVGSLNSTFLTNLFHACAGIMPIAGKSMKAMPDTSNFKVHFPTTKTVRESKAGGAGTICFQSSFYNNPQFPKSSLVSHIAVRPRLLSHCKILIYRIGNDTSETNNGWAYIGSANCSASAWGDKVVKDRVKKVDKLTCRNWETGVLVRLDKIKDRLPVRLDHDIINDDPWFFMEQ